ncbi:MAG: lamin tail domain-containing protein, partial [Bacteroidales bacterium]|nr:lamin tail domain-containing protein [Bacteroidales bacterium]
MTSNNDKTIANYALDITLSQSSILYIILDNRIGDTSGEQGTAPNLTAAGMTWINNLGFTDTQQDIGIDESGDGTIDSWSSVFSLDVPGGTITLGAQNDSANRNMYTVAAVAGGSGNTNNPPEVDAGNYDSLSWPNDTLQLSPIVSDDDPCGLEILTVKWSLISGPNSVDFDPSDDIQNPSVIFHGPGSYILQLEAWDELSQRSYSRVTIEVIEPLLGDLNIDNKVNWKDILLFAEQWLDPVGSQADIDGKDGVNVRDFAFIANNWLVGEGAMLVINEFMAQNYTSVTDPQGDNDDWIEIYNAGDTEIDVAGMYLTD